MSTPYQVRRRAFILSQLESDLADIEASEMGKAQKIEAKAIVFAYAAPALNDEDDDTKGKPTRTAKQIERELEDVFADKFSTYTPGEVAIARALLLWAWDRATKETPF